MVQWIWCIATKYIGIDLKKVAGSGWMKKAGDCVLWRTRGKQQPSSGLQHCSQCSFTAQFESSLMMHRQLHHEDTAGSHDDDVRRKIVAEKLKKTPRELSPSSVYSKKVKGLRIGSRTASATRMLGKLRARICRPKALSPHPEDPLNLMLNTDLSCRSDCTSKALKMDSPSRISALSPCREPMKETYACHLCSFDADRITVLDRHLLNDHKIGLENLLKLVLAKTKDGLCDDNPPEVFGMRIPYYRPVDDNNGEILDDGEFVIETVTPKIKILKHCATNTDLTWSDIPHLQDNCRMITKELNKLIKCPARMEKDDLLEKMQTLNHYMCKFVDSSNTLKKVLSRDGKYSQRGDPGDQPFFDLRLRNPDTPRTPRDWESEKLQIYRSKHRDFRSNKSKFSADSYYF